MSSSLFPEEEDPDLFSSKLFELQDVLNAEKGRFDLSCSIGYSGGIPSSSLGLRKIINQADKQPCDENIKKRNDRRIYYIHKR